MSRGVVTTHLHKNLDYRFVFEGKLKEIFWKLTVFSWVVLQYDKDSRKKAWYTQSGLQNYTNLHYLVWFYKNLYQNNIQTIWNVNFFVTMTKFTQETEKILQDRVKSLNPWEFSPFSFSMAEYGVYASSNYHSRDTLLPYLQKIPAGQWTACVNTIPGSEIFLDLACIAATYNITVVRQSLWAPRLIRCSSTWVLVWLVGWFLTSLLDWLIRSRILAPWTGAIGP